MLGTVSRELRHAIRALRRNPSVTSVAVVILALGIGALTAVFGLVDATLLKPLPYPDPDRILMLWRQAPPNVNIGYAEIPWSRDQFQRLQSSSRAFEHLGAFVAERFTLTGNGDPAPLEGIRASAGFFGALGVQPLLGRTYTPEEDRPGAGHVAVLSYDLWVQRFGGDRRIVGQIVHLDGDPYTVVGVMPRTFAFPRAEEMPASFTFPKRVDMWTPLALISGARTRQETSDVLAVVARLRAASSVAAAQADLAVNTADMERALGPAAKDWFNVRAVPLERQAAARTRRPLILMLGAFGLLLSIVCSNVASLQVAKALERRRDFAVRSALGASAGRLATQILTESLVVATAGGLLGIAVADIGIRVVRFLGPQDLPRLEDASLDWRVFVFALTITIASAIAFGLAPVWSILRTNPAGAFGSGSRLTGSRRATRLRRVLPIVEVALALVLAVGATLLAKTLYHLAHVDPGFRTDNVLTFQLSLPAPTYPTAERQVALYSRLLAGIRALPGVAAAGVTETIPIGGATEATGLRIPGRPANPNESLIANYTVVSPGYFEAVGTPLLRGRTFVEGDTSTSLPVTVINSSMARRFWPDRDPIGRQVGPGTTRFPAATIVGVVADVKRLSLREEPSPEMYVVYTQKVYPSLATMSVVMRGRTSADVLVESAKTAVRAVDANLAVANVLTLDTAVDRSLASERFSALLLAAIAAIAAIVAAVGLYGVLAHSVAERTRELGIRMALGAERSRLVAMVLAEGVGLAAVGIVLGLAAAIGAGRFIASYLYGVAATDPVTLAAVSLTLGGVAVLASCVPARRATAVDPILALRSD